MLLIYCVYPRLSRIPARYFAQLGVQTSAHNVLWESLVMACDNIPSSDCMSFTIYDFRHTDYAGNEVLKPTGYASFNVKYYSTESEGMFKVADYIEHTYIGKYYDGKPTHDLMGRPIGKLAKELRELN